MSLTLDQEPQTDSDLKTIKSWSHSRWENFRKCAHRAELLYIRKLEEPRPPLREGQTEYANDRGTRVHEAGEMYLKGGVELLPELQAFAPEYARLRELADQGKVSIEGEWGFDVAWRPVAYLSPDCWLRVKIDYKVTMDPTWVVIIDLKTGKKNGNEIKHAEQTQLYTVATVMRFPEIQRVTTELWYADQDDLTRVEYTRDQALRFFKAWNEHGFAITQETEFKPNPNKFSCQYCRFSPKNGGNGVCPVGV